MEPIAILGATSQLALDFVASTVHRNRALSLYARRPDAVRAALDQREIACRHEILPLGSFGARSHGGIVNFIGIGDPSKTVMLGAGILSATREWDERVLAHLARQPEIPYVFLSSGAIYGEAFTTPVDARSTAAIPINALGPQSWYGLAKLFAETQHRIAADRTIVDIRVFNYISRSLDKDARFLMTDMIRAIENDALFETSDVPIVRDYLHPADLVSLIEAALEAPRGTNMAVDAYSRAPITKQSLLDLMARHFRLRAKVVPSADVVNATGVKPHYYSLNRAAASLGYAPTRTSAEAIIEEVGAVLAARAAEDERAVA